MVCAPEQVPVPVPVPIQALQAGVEVAAPAPLPEPLDEKSSPELTPQRNPVASLHAPAPEALPLPPVVALASAGPVLPTTGSGYAPFLSVQCSLAGIVKASPYLIASQRAFPRKAAPTPAATAIPALSLDPVDCAVPGAGTEQRAETGGSRRSSSSSSSSIAASSRAAGSIAASRLQLALSAYRKVRTPGRIVAS